MISNALSYLGAAPPNRIDILRHQKVLAEHLLMQLQNGCEMADDMLKELCINDTAVTVLDAIVRDAAGYHGVVVVADSTPLDLAQQWGQWSLRALEHCPLQTTRVLDTQGQTVCVCNTPDASLLPPSLLTSSTSVTATSPSVEELAQTLAAWRLIGQEADQAADRLEEQIAQQMPPQAFVSEDTKSFGIARSKLNKVFDPAKVDAAVVEQMTALKFGPQEIATHYTNHPNFWVEGKIDVDTLLGLLETHLQVDVRQDERFAPAVGERRPNMTTRVEFLKDLSKDNPLEWDELVDWSATKVKTELIREPLTGPTKELRTAITSALRQHIDPLASHMGRGYAQARASLQASLPPTKPKRARPPKNKA